jgi:hypothetical protein
MLRSARQLYRRLRYGEPIIVVSGLPRSGTSMAMKMLEAGGLSTVSDGVRTADVDNPKGYFEDERVKDLHKDVDKTWLRDSRGKVVKIISFLLSHLPETNNYRVLFMRRHLDEVLASQTKMLERRGEPSETSDDKMVELWENHLWRASWLMKKRPHIEALDVHYTAVLEDPRREAERIRDFLGRPLDVDKMAAVVDASLYRNRAAE